RGHPGRARPRAPPGVDRRLHHRWRLARPERARHRLDRGRQGGGPGGPRPQPVRGPTFRAASRPRAPHAARRASGLPGPCLGPLRTVLSAASSGYPLLFPVRALPLLVVTCVASSACPRTPAAVADGGTAALTPTSGGGDHRRGWPVYLDHCVECHGEGRRGDGDRSTRLEVHPVNLRDPLLLATRTDDQLAKAISQGGAFVGRSKALPAFREELSERDILDLLALLRGDALALEDCFPDAAVWTRLTPPEAREPVMAAYAFGRPRAGRPKVTSGQEVPAGGTLVG